MCRLFFVTVKRKTVIVEQHHEVLTAWAEFHRGSEVTPAVLTLDFHTDTLSCLRRKIQDPADAAEAVRVLHHDEHFDWALRHGIISQAVIIALAPCAMLPAHPALEVRRSRLLPDMDVMLNEPEKFRPVAGMVLDDDFLGELLSDGFPSMPYILDVDCDVFTCEKALHPRNGKIISRLAENAGLITISKENDWVKILKLPGENVTGSDLAAKLQARPGWGA